MWTKIKTPCCGSEQQTWFNNIQKKYGFSVKEKISCRKCGKIYNWVSVNDKSEIDWDWFDK
jgi:hypothetical protein